MGTANLVRKPIPANASTGCCFISSQQPNECVQTAAGQVPLLVEPDSIGRRSTSPQRHKALATLDSLPNNHHDVLRCRHPRMLRNSSLVVFQLSYRIQRSDT